MFLFGYRVFARQSGKTGYVDNKALQISNIPKKTLFLGN
jgi:hypothetical protein